MFILVTPKKPLRTKVWSIIRIFKNIHSYLKKTKGCFRHY